MSEKTQGTVKWFSRVKGYGFIQPDGASEDVFVHYTAIVGEGFRNLDEGQRVEFAIEDSSKGPQAAEVMKLEPEEESSEGFQAAEVMKVEPEEESSEGFQAAEVIKVEPEEDSPEGPQAAEVTEPEQEDETS
jgi:CspA family cold shock protein